MSSQSSKLHFVFIPLMCPGHLIPMVDMGRLLAQHGVTVTIVTTPLNASRIKTIIDRDIASGIQLQLLQLRFPCIDAGLPEGCENIDALPSRLLSKNFMDAVGMLQQPLERFLEETEPKPSSVLLSLAPILSTFHENVSDDLEPFVVPGLPDRIELTKGQLPNDLNPGSVVLKVKEEDMRVADMASYGLVVNSFEELEPRSGWLDSWPQNSVTYVCLGTIIELALGLEESNRPFIWVVREGYKSDEFNKWLSEEGFEERNKGRGLLIHGWAPQLSILSHTFMNEKLVVQVLGIGERVGADIAMKWREEEPYGVMVKREEITKAINLVMDSGNEGEERRKRAMKLQVLANKAFENKGSSCLNVKRLIKDISQISGTKD
ncbi:hypothetical protein Goklo_018527 [Gossypium klotzschianum]|uniref:UDP-glycosyltransferase n=1 Tax=Gossypium klotzschianum TaxID=34286 RepID=A0A7J8ULM7_9ROSI|nr:hypothetical protein [Gossypium klotzschianum]